MPDTCDQYVVPLEDEHRKKMSAFERDYNEDASNVKDWRRDDFELGTMIGKEYKDKYGEDYDVKKMEKMYFDDMTNTVVNN